MKQVKIFLLLLMIFIASDVIAQPEAVIFPNLENLEVKGKENRKAQYALAKCGLSFSYDAANQNLLLKIHDPRYLSKIFNHRKDKLELQIGDQIFVLTGKLIREQLKRNYFQIHVPEQVEYYEEVINRYMSGFNIQDTIHDDHRELYRDFKTALSDLDLAGDVFSIIKKDIRKNYRTYKKDYRRFKKFLKDKSKSIVRKDDGPWVITFENVVNDDFNINFYKKNLKIAKLQFDTLYASPADLLSQYEIAECEPFDRYTYFKKIKGLGLQRYKFKPYQPVEKMVGYIDFTIYFEQNESKCSREDLKEILTLLNDSSYTIRKAKVYAYASVEGDEDINLKLQKDRAKVMLDLLQQYNRDSIEIVEFHTDENWERFNKQIKGSKYQSWVDLSKEKVKSLLTDSIIANDWEDSLAVQRKAVLKLQLYHQPDTIHQIKYAIKTYKTLINQYISYCSRIPKGKEGSMISYQLKILAVEDFLKQMVRKGKLPVEKFNEVQSFSHPAIDNVRFYSMMLDDEKGLANVYTNKEEIVAKAYDAVLGALYNTNHNKYRQQYWQRQAIDIQVYAFEQIDDKKLSSEVICEFAWPDKSVFYPLILNELDYINKKSISFIGNLSCYNVDTTKNNDNEFINKENPHAVSFNPPLDYRIPHTDYYFFLKKRLLENDQDIRKMVVRSDDYFEFDMYDLLWYNIINWDVWNNRYYDDEVDYRKMIKLMDKLIEVNDILCPTQLYQLYLDLHLRVSFLVRHDSGHRVSKQVYYSLRKLYKYYLDNLAWVKEEDALKLANHLIWMGKYFHNNETINMARHLLSKLDQHGLISDENQKNYNELLTMNKK